MLWKPKDKRVLEEKAINNVQYHKGSNKKKNLKTCLEDLGVERSWSNSKSVLAGCGVSEMVETR